MPMPAPTGPWLARCIEHWGLLAPFDPSVTEAQWEAYFKERAATEGHSYAFVVGAGCGCCVQLSSRSRRQSV